MTKQDLEKIAYKLNLPVEVVEKTYRAYWFSIKSIIESLPLKEDISDLEFLKLRTNFNLPSLGKLSCTLDKFHRIKERYNYIDDFRNGGVLELTNGGV